MCTDGQDRTVMKPINLSTPYESEGIHRHFEEYFIFIKKKRSTKINLYRSRTTTFTRLTPPQVPCLRPSFESLSIKRYISKSSYYLLFNYILTSCIQFSLNNFHTDLYTNSWLGDWGTIPDCMNISHVS